MWEIVAPIAGSWRCLAEPDFRQGQWTVYTPARRHKPHDPSVRHGSIKCTRRQPWCPENAACIVNWPDLSRHAGSAGPHPEEPPTGRANARPMTGSAASRRMNGTSGAAWFSRRCGASSGDGAARLLTM